MLSIIFDFAVVELLGFDVVSAAAFVVASVSFGFDDVDTELSDLFEVFPLW